MRMISKKKLKRPSRDSNPNLRLRRPAGYPDYPTRAVNLGSPMNLKILAKTGCDLKDIHMASLEIVVPSAGSPRALHSDIPPS